MNAAQQSIGPRTTLRFDQMMNALQVWRDADNADAITLTRGEIIEIIEGVKALRKSEAA